MPQFFMDSPVIERLGWTLIQSLWQFLAVAVVTALVLRSVYSAAVRYWTALAGLVVIAALPIVTWISLPVQETSPTDVAVQANATRPPLRQMQPVFPVVQGDDPRVADEFSPAQASVADEELVAAIAKDSAITGAGSIAASRSWIDSITAFLAPRLKWIVAGWMIGVLCFGFRPLLGWRTVHRLRRKGLAAVSPPIPYLLEHIAMRLRLKRIPAIALSSLVTVPVVVGWLRPIILLPCCAATGLTASQLEAVLAHELAHIRRHDTLVNLIQTLFETLLFYHPAVWWLSRRIREERENCCDDLAVAALGDRVEYGRALLAIDELRGLSPSLAVGMGGSLLSRIRRLGNAATGQNELGRGSLVVAMASLLVCGLLIGRSFATAKTEPTAPMAEDGTAPTFRGIVQEIPAMSPVEGADVEWRLLHLQKMKDGKIEPSATKEVAWTGTAKSDETGRYDVQIPLNILKELREERTQPDRVHTVESMFRVIVLVKKPDFVSISHGETYLPDPGDRASTQDITTYLRPAVEVSGRFLLPDGSPAFDLLVMLGRNREGFGSGRDAIYARTDKNGRFRIVTQKEWPQRLHWFPENHVSDSRALTQTFGEQWPIRLKDGPRLVGRVVDEQEQPVSGIAVKATTGTRVPYLFASTDDDGRFRFPPSPPGLYRLQTRPTYKLKGSDGTMLSVADSSHLLLISEGDGQIREARPQWQDPQELIALSKLKIEISGDGSVIGEPEVETREGRMKLTEVDLKPTSNVVAAVEESKSDAVLEDKGSKPAAQADPPPKPAALAPVIKGAVQDENGNPVGGAEVGLQVWGFDEQDRLPEHDFVAMATTNVDGTYQISVPKDVDPGNRLGTVWAFADGFIPVRPAAYGTVTGLIDRPANVKLLAAGETTVRVLSNDGSPAANVTVKVASQRLPEGIGWPTPKRWAARLQAVTDANGEAKIPNSIPGAIDGIILSREGFADIWLNMNYFLNVHPASSGPTFQFQLPKTGTIAGRLIHDGLELPSKLKIKVQTESRLPDHPNLSAFGQVEVEPDAEGRFEIAGMPPGQAFVFPFLPEDQSLRAVLPSSLVSQPDVSTPFDIQIVRGVLARGQIRAADTKKGIPNFSLIVLYGQAGRTGDSMYERFNRTTDNEGRFSAVVPPGPVQLRLQSFVPGYQDVGSWRPADRGRLGTIREVPKDVAQFDLEPIDLDPAVPIKGTLVDADGAVLSDWTVFGYPEIPGERHDMVMNSFPGVHTNEKGEFGSQSPKSFLPTRWVASHRDWPTPFTFEDRKRDAKVLTQDPLVLQVDVKKADVEKPAEKKAEPAKEDETKPVQPSAAGEESAASEKPRNALELTTGWGSIEGRILLEGDAPMLPPIPTALPAPDDVVPDERLIVDPDSGGIANVLVFLQKAPDRIHPSDQPNQGVRMLKTAGTRYSPHVLAMRTGQSLDAEENPTHPCSMHVNPLLKEAKGFIVSAGGT